MPISIFPVCCRRSGAGQISIQEEDNMRRLVLVVGLVCALAMAGVSVASAQESGSQNGGFTVGSSDIGPVIGLGSNNGAGLSYGGRFEHGFKAVGKGVGRGVVGIGVGVDYYSYGQDFSPFGLTNFKYSVLPISVTGNYHFQLANKKVDPFLGAGIGYTRVTASYTGIYPGLLPNVSASSTGVVGHAGLRYYMQPGMSFYVDIGGGNGATLHTGLMFKMGGK